jgi:hypothetical protein
MRFHAPKVSGGVTGIGTGIGRPYWTGGLPAGANGSYV